MNDNLTSADRNAVAESFLGCAPGRTLVRPAEQAPSVEAAVLVVQRQGVLL